MSTHASLNPVVSNLQPSATLAINEHCQRLVDQGRQVYRLGFGQSPFPVPAPVVAELQRQAHRKAYLPTQGLPELRQAIAGYLQRTEGLDYAAEQVLVGPGTKELMFLLQFAYQAQLVLPAPSWVSYAPQAGILGREVCWLQSDLEHTPGLDPQLLERHCQADPTRARLLVLNYPSNPTGDAYTAAQLADIAEVARRYQVLVLSDEIYSGLHFAGDHVSIARFYPEGTIVCNGLSKWCGAGGWRLGAFAFPPQLAWLQRAMAALVTETFTSVSSPIQYAAAVAFSHNEEVEAYLAAAGQIMQAVMHYTCGQLRAAGALVCEPLGGFYLFPRFDGLQGHEGIIDSSSLCSRVLEETGVALLPGTDFGRPAQELSARIACVDFDGAEAMDAFAGLEPGKSPGQPFLRAYCANTMDGVDRLHDWLVENART